MGKKILAVGLRASFLLLLLCVLSLGICSFWIPDSISVFRGDALPDYPCFSLDETVGEDGDSTAALKLFGVIPVREVEVRKYDKLSLTPGGFVFGVRILTGGVRVAGFSDVCCDGQNVSPAREAGMAVGDVILTIDGREVKCVADVTGAVERTVGGVMSFRCRRGKEEMTFSVKPRKSDEDARYKTGIWVRDSSSGIGTVTFIDPATGAFGGLGHGICDADSGELLQFTRGTVTGVRISGVTPGSVGAPGEICGMLQSGKTGSLLKNSECGVFGVLQALPENLPAALPVALSGEVKTGDAKILCSLDGEGVKEYSVKITALNRLGRTKSFSIRVTDPALLARSGGIVQGMSGSPVLQNGKLIGAVTHVLINDPTGGYGIFIENMLDEMPIEVLPQ